MPNNQSMSQPSVPHTDLPAAEKRESPLSLSRLRDAFAAMLGNRRADDAAAPEAAKSQRDKSNASDAAVDGPCEINPRSVVESMLFVGRPDNGPISTRELAAAMRGVSPAEIETTVADLNRLYHRDEAPYWIEQSGGGYRLTLQPEFERVRDKFYGKVKEVRLSPSVLEVLSILAYNQPATVEQLNELRGSACGAALATLVRRKLARLDRTQSRDSPTYATTDRFLKLFNLENLASLPRSEELNKV
jgi:segregation and condensation protein B